MQELKVKEFKNNEELCAFVNENLDDYINPIETITVFNGLLQLFYWD